jgi:hypothetical protein
MSSRGLVLLLLAPVVAAAVGVAVAGATNSRDLVLRLNGFAGRVIPVADGQRVCQRRLDPSESFAAVRFGAQAGTPSDARVLVTVRRDGRVLARGRPRPARQGGARRLARLDRTVPAGGPIAVCFSNKGGQPLALYGSVARLPIRDVVVGGRPRRLSLQMDLLGERRSALSMVGTVFQRASVERPAGVGPWLFWLLAAGILVGVPVVLAGALRASTPED